MDKKVTVLTPHGRRQNVKVTPNTTILQILEEVCEKQGFDSDEYCLQHHKKEVGLTQMFRFSGLPNNCLLEMEKLEKRRVASSVEMCVQLESGTRVHGDQSFKPSDSVWYVVEQLCPTAADEYESPVAIYMRQEVIGKQNMSDTTLKSLGILDGRAMIRLINKNPEELKTQANVYIPPSPKPISKENEPASTSRSFKSGGSSGKSFEITKDLVQSLKQPQSSEKTKINASSEDDENERDMSTPTPDHPEYDWGTAPGHSMKNSASDMQLQAAEAAGAEADVEEPEVHIIGARDAILYSLDSTEKQFENLPDSFFDLTVQDLKLVLRDLKRVSTGSENAPLLTEKLREMHQNQTMLHKIAQYKNCVIRIQFPDRHVLQGIFKPIDLISDVMEFVRSFLSNGSQNFHLFTIPPKTVLPLDKTLLELDFVPTALVHFGPQEDDKIAEDHPYLKSEFFEKLTTAEGALFAANKLRSMRTPTSSVGTPSADPLSSPYERKSPGPSTGAIPKRPRADEAKRSPH